MRGLNLVQVIGNLGAKPELQYTATGKAVTHMRVAVDRRWRDADGQLQEKTEWFRTVLWGRQAEIASQYLQKGSPVYIEGRLETSSFEGADGRARYVTELVARNLILLPKGDGQPTPQEELVEVEESL